MRKVFSHCTLSFVRPFLYMFQSFEDKARGTISAVSAVVALVATLCTIVGAAGASTEQHVLQDCFWLTATDIEEIEYFAGLNAIYIASQGSGIVKYVDCEKDFCAKCSSVSVGITTMLIFSAVVGFISCVLCLISMCKPQLNIACGVTALISLVLTASSMGSFKKCYDAFKHQRWISDVSYDGVAYAVIAASVLMGVNVFLCMVSHFVETRSTVKNLEYKN